MYARFRPVYPENLYTFLLSVTPERALAWDCGCGNGQVAGVLANYFEKVEASDISSKQLEYAVKKPNIHYQVAPADNTNLPDKSVDLITVAQAIHWFDFNSFYAEVHRVSKPGATLAVWGYSLPEVNGEIDSIVGNFYADTLGSKYWDAERHFVDEQYRTIPFPFEDMETPEFSINANWQVDHLIGYLNSWSAVQHYIRKNNANPVEQIVDSLRKAWGNQPIAVTFPLFMRLAKVKPNQ